MSEQTQELKFRGVPVFFDGREWIVPSLSVRQFRDNLDLLSGVVERTSAADPKQIVAMMNDLVPVIGLAIRRNYPEVTDDQLFDVLDISTFTQAIRAVQGASGMKAAQPGE
jgi:hypothetical protein